MPRKSMFDATAFASTPVEGAHDTTYIVVPEGDDYTGSISRVDFRNGTNKNGDMWVRAEISFLINDEDGEIREITGRDQNVVRKGIFLDVKDGPNGSPVLDMAKGKNVALGKIREAAGQNWSNRPWDFSMLVGTGPYRFSVKHRVVTNEETEEETVYAEVGQVNAAD